jgi:uncharacterized protein
LPFDIAELAVLAGSLLAAGLAAGVIAGLLGVGGGVVIVPVLSAALTLMGTPESIVMQVAVGTSLASIIPTAISSNRAHYSRGAVDIDLLKSWAPAVAAGVLIGSAVAASVKGPVLSAVFGVVALGVAAHMTFVPETLRLSDHPPQGWIKNAVCVAIGAFSSMMGIGGGSLTVPTLTLCNYPIRRAVGTSSAMGLVIAVPGAIGFIVGGWGVPDRPDFSLGFVNLLGFALIVPASMWTAPFGAKLAHSIPPRVLRRAFAAFLAVTSVKMLYTALT